MSGAFENFLPYSRFSNRLLFYQYKLPFEKISEYLGREKKALDWGCGNGHFSSFLLHNKQRTVAYGFGETEAPEPIAGNPLLEFVPANTNEPVKLPFPDASFDLVFSLGVLEHVHESGGDQLSSLKEVKRILKPGGHFFCFHFPYIGSWVEILSNAIRPFRKVDKYTHTRRFSKRDVVRLNERAGLSLEEWGRYNFLPRNVTQGFSKSTTNNLAIVSGFNKLDKILGDVFPVLCNQSYFISKKI